MVECDIITVVCEVCRLVHSCDAERKKMYDLCGYDYEGSFGESVAKIIDSYIDQAQKLIGDEAEFLPWFIYENEYGIGNKSVFIGDIQYRVNNIKDLAHVIAEYAVQTGRSDV